MARPTSGLLTAPEGTALEAIWIGPALVNWAAIAWIDFHGDLTVVVHWHDGARVALRRVLTEAQYTRLRAALGDPDLEPVDA